MCALEREIEREGWWDANEKGRARPAGEPLGRRTAERAPMEGERQKERQGGEPARGAGVVESLRLTRRSRPSPEAI